MKYKPHRRQMEKMWFDNWGAHSPSLGDGQRFFLIEVSHRHIRQCLHLIFPGVQMDRGDERNLPYDAVE